LTPTNGIRFDVASRSEWRVSAVELGDEAGELEEDDKGDNGEEGGGEYSRGRLRDWRMERGIRGIGSEGVDPGEARTA
jgi:hypothetical protein